MLNSAHYRKQLEKLPCLSVPADAVQIHHSAREFKTRILQLIAAAKERIYLVALYLQDDEAGREILEALRLAKQANPEGSYDAADEVNTDHVQRVVKPERVL